MANFGIGLGAFADGFARGVGIRRQMNISKAEERKLKQDEAKQEAFGRAKSEYDALSAGGQPDANGVQAFPVGESGAPQPKPQKFASFTDYLYSQALPKIIDETIAAGDLKGAEDLRKWGEDEKERKFIDGFGKTLNAFAAGQSDGNYEPFAQQTMDLLNKGGYGVKATGFEMVKDGGGNQVGIKFNLKDGDREYSHTFNSMEEAGNFIAGQGDPRMRVKLFQSQVDSASKFKQKMAEEEGKARIGLGKDLALEDAKQTNRLQVIAANSKQNGSKTQQEFEYMQGVLKANGFSDEEIRAYTPAMLKIGEYRKGRSPEEYAQQLVLELSKDPMMSQKPIEEIKAKAMQLLELSQSLAGRGQQQARPPATQPGIVGSTTQRPPVWTGR